MIESDYWLPYISPKDIPPEKWISYDLFDLFVVLALFLEWPGFLLLWKLDAVNGYELLIPCMILLYLYIWGIRYELNFDRWNKKWHSEIYEMEKINGESMANWMMSSAFKVMSLFWILSPVGFVVGRFLGVWRTGYDWGIFLGLAVASTITLFLNYEPK